MSKSIIIYNVPGGKTRFAQRIAKHFGLSRVNYRNGTAPWEPEGSIYFIPRIDSPIGTSEYARSFQSVADEINASIPLTDWQSGPPPMVGEWNASFGANFPNRRRWWDGERWSHVWIDGLTSQELSNKSAAIRIEDAEGMVWRGLSQEPIKVTE